MTSSSTDELHIEFLLSSSPTSSGTTALLTTHRVSFSDPRMLAGECSVIDVPLLSSSIRTASPSLFIVTLIPPEPSNTTLSMPIIASRTPSLPCIRRKMRSTGRVRGFPCTPNCFRSRGHCTRNGRAGNVFLTLPTYPNRESTRRSRRATTRSKIFP